MQQLFSFSEIPEQGIYLEINDTSWFPDEQVQRIGPVTATLFLAKKGVNKVEVRGRLQTEVLLTCDRCIAEFVKKIDESIQLILEVNDPDHRWRVQDLDSTEVDIDTVLVDVPQVDLGDILREQVFLSLPEKRLCRQSCAGLCKNCGANLNEEKCFCPQEKKDSPFALLSRLKKTEK